jgi:hypothetical protein
MPSKRMNFLIDDESFEVLEAIKKKRAIPYSGTMRRALKFWGYVTAHKEDGHSIQVRDADGKLIKTVDIF